ncbi:hypothetical protein ACFSTC_33050 [Nonomuraea ferruginea]
MLVSSDDARLLEWRLGRLRQVSQLEQEDLEAPHERVGQIGGGPAGQYNTPMREQRKARERAWAQRFLDRVAETVTNLTEERRWERILVSGGDQWAEILVEQAPGALAGPGDPGYSRARRARRPGAAGSGDRAAPRRAHRERAPSCSNRSWTPG